MTEEMRQLTAARAERDRARDLAAGLEAQLAEVAALAEEWRYKGEWGAWQEGYGPDHEGYVLDQAAGSLRDVLNPHEAEALRGEV